MGNIPRSSAALFALELDGKDAGFVKSAEGGEITADVVEVRSGNDLVSRKHLAAPRVEPFDLRIDLGQGNAMFDWIADTWKGNAPRRSGAIVEADQKLDAQARREFRDALITEVTIPALDGSSKDPAPLTVKFAPEEVQRKKASGRVAGRTERAKQFLPSNFRLELDGLDCTKVAKIDAFTVKQAVAADDVGDHRLPTRRATLVEFPNLKVTVSEAAAKTWDEWFEDFVVKGDNGDDKEKKGAIVFLDPTLKKELGRIMLSNVGIFALRRKRRTDDQVPRFTAELYCEVMELKMAASEAVQPTPPVRPSRPARPEPPAPPGP